MIAHIARMPSSIVSPVTTSLSTSPPNAPCFATQNSILTESAVRKHLKTLLLKLKLDTSLYNFHTVRHSGTTLAYNLDVNIERIKRHRT